MAATMPRAVRVPDDVWRAALERARADGTTLTAVVVDALRKYAERDQS
jgi:hypothetical protein